MINCSPFTAHLRHAGNLLSLTLVSHPTATRRSQARELAAVPSTVRHSPRQESPPSARIRHRESGAHALNLTTTTGGSSWVASSHETHNCTQADWPKRKLFLYTRVQTATAMGATCGNRNILWHILLQRIAQLFMDSRDYRPAIGCINAATHVLRCLERCRCSLISGDRPPVSLAHNIFRECCNS